MIPKIIHYCWFGSAPIPEEYQSYIRGWKEKMPDYQLMLWNEHNSPMHLPYLQAALQYKKWANLSNFVRIYALFHHGGIYMDTDMEVIKPLDKFRQHGCFLGLELGDQDNKEIIVNNAIFGAEKGHPFVVRCMEFYLNYFDGRDSALDSSPYLVTRLLKEAGLKQYGRQQLAGVDLYPRTYFYPYHITEKFHPDCVKDQTHTIHHWGYSWGKRPFSYRLEALKKRTKEAFYQLLPIAGRGYLKQGKLTGDLLRGGRVKAGPFEGVKLKLTANYEEKRLPLKLSGLFKEELQMILYKLTNIPYRYVYYNGADSSFWLEGLKKLFPKASIQALSKEASPMHTLVQTESPVLLITNSRLSADLVAHIDQIPDNTDVVLEFNHHLSAESRKKLLETIHQNRHLEYVHSNLNHRYEQNAFLENYALKELENNLKKSVTEVYEWVLLKGKRT